MWAAWEPTYACLQLGLWEEEGVFTSLMYQDHVHMWLRYIDDVLLLWRGDLENLHNIIGQLNDNIRNIHLTYTYDREQISFLDLWISMEKRLICTRTFCKETTANTI